MKPIVIVGGGIAGLSAGCELAKQGRKVVIIEKESRVGGLARSFVYGDYTFDIGPHRFFTDKPVTRDFIIAALDGQEISIQRRSGLYFLGKYYEWPLQPTALLNLPLPMLLRSAGDLLLLGLRDHGQAENFEGYIIRHYGPTLYEAFFKEYTEKFLGIAPQKTHAQWAKTGMKQAVIDESMASRNLLHILAQMIRSVPAPRTRFIYPRGGIGCFCDSLCAMIRQSGGEIVTGDSVAALRVEGGRIERVTTHAGRSWDPDSVVWTAPLTEVTSLLSLPPVGLEYLSLVLYNLELDEPARLKYQWCYFGSKDIVFSRVSVPALFSGQSCPAGAGSLCVEVTCRADGPIWNEPEKILPAVKADLREVGLIRAPARIKAVHIEKVANAYPCYGLDYEEKLAAAKKNLSAFRNLTLAGRTGLFWYNNMDDSIENGRAIATGAGCPGLAS